jgi:hypothetical protein
MKQFQSPLFIALFILCSFQMNAQENTANTIENQFDNIYRTSSTYQNYKVINRDRFNTLKSRVLDSLKVYSKSISAKEKTITAKSSEIESLKKELAETNTKLTEAISKENSFSFLGIEIAKGTYNLMVWALVGILLAGLIHFIYQFAKSNSVTKTALSDLEEVEKEFEAHRKKTLEREQKLRRQLHDEINKNRNS